MDNVEVIEWPALEYHHHDKGSNWFWVVGIVGVVAVFLAVLFKSFLFAILLLIATFTVLLYGARPPELVNFALTPKGIKIKDRLYLYRHLKSFWVLDDPDHPAHRRQIIIESEKVFLPHIILPLPESVGAPRVRDYLIKHLPEVEHQESLADLVADYLGF